jgi:NitT/TauT family transport system ATP-binding protein
LLLADRVIVPSDRPARFSAEYVLGKPQPRRRGDPDIARLRQTVLETLGAVYG